MPTGKLVSTRSLQHLSTRLRQKKKIILTPRDIAPSHSRLHCLAVLNPTTTVHKGRRRIIFRADEYAIDQENYNCRDRRLLPVPTLANDFKSIVITDVHIPPGYDFREDAVLPDEIRRVARGTDLPAILLPYMSHIRTAELDERDNVGAERIYLFPNSPFSAFGCEDPRVSVIEGKSFVTYNATGYYGNIPFRIEYDDTRYATAQMILGPDHKHACYFPVKINGRYFMLIRPLTKLIFVNTLGIWLYSSRDLHHWRVEQPLIMPRPKYWDAKRVGPGAAPIQTPQGFLMLYYGVDNDDTYHIGACLLDENEPGKVLGRSVLPILSPDEEWERNGRRADVVFPCGATLLRDGEVKIYYGAADTVMSVATSSLDDIFSTFD
jgi:beta-1,2-mannobiose phosphorylase / 1,2-beta-oligomannan phosphorylase